MRVLVTGDRGYIGSVMVPMMLAEGFDVVGLDTDYFDGCDFGQNQRMVFSLNKDLRNVQIGDMRHFDAIIHLGGLSNDPLGEIDPVLTYDINHHASLQLALFAKDAGINRFLFSSSCSNYGSAGDDLLTEDSPLNPLTAYGISKVRVEKDVSSLADDNFSPTFLRNGTAYGVSPRLRLDIVLNNLVASAFTTGKILLNSDGRAWRPIVHIEDISRAFIEVLKAPREKVHNQIFNVGAVEGNYRILEIAEMVREMIPCEIEYVPNAKTDLRCYRVDCSKLLTLFPEYKPKWTARKGVCELYEAYKSIGLSHNDFVGSRYKRLDHITSLMRVGLLDSDLRWTKVLKVLEDKPMDNPEDLKLTPFPDVGALDLVFPDLTSDEIIHWKKEAELAQYNPNFGHMAASLFFNGGKVPRRPDVSDEEYTRGRAYLQKWLGSYAPRHEDKELVAGYILSRISILTQGN